MAVIEFGSGILYGDPTSGNLPVNPTPIRLLLQEVSVEFKGDLKKLYTQSQFPIATARGKIDVAGKAKIVNYDPDPINQLFWAQSIAAGIQIPVDQELDYIPSSAAFTITVQNASGFALDNGVSYATGAKSGAVLLNVASAPTVGQYVVNVSSGVYTFNFADNATGVYISYTYTNATRGKTISLTSELMGYAPVCRMDVWNNFRGKVLGIRLNACTLGQWTYPSKLEDFWMSDITFDANLDSSNNLGAIFADTY